MVEFSTETGQVKGSILVWDPPRAFEHEWIVDRPGFKSAEYGIIRRELDSEDSDTVLRLSRKLPSRTARNLASGMHKIIDRLES